MLIATSTLLSCKKESAPQQPTQTLPDMKGTWTGKWGDNFDTPVKTYRLQVKTENVVDINNGFADYVGTWRIDGYTFVASYVISGQTLTLKAAIDKAHMEGIWRNTTTNEYKGTFYLDKQ